MKNNSELFNMISDRFGKKVGRWSQAGEMEIIDLIKNYPKKVQNPGWLSACELAGKYKLRLDTTQRLLNRYRDQVNFFCQMWDEERNLIECISPDGVEQVGQFLESRYIVPEGWLSIKELAKISKHNFSDTNSFAKRYKKEFPDGFKLCKNLETGYEKLFVSPEIVKIVTDHLLKNVSYKDWKTEEEMQKIIDDTFSK